MPQAGYAPYRFFHRRLFALIVGVVFSMPSAGDQAVVPDDFETIADALAAVAGTTNATVIVEPGTYREDFSLPDDVVLRGRETARTFLRGTGTGPVVTAAGTQGSRISNFTFTGTGDDVAIAVDRASDLVISNNVFALGTDRTAISVASASPASSTTSSSKTARPLLSAGTVSRSGTTPSWETWRR